MKRLASAIGALAALTLGSAAVAQPASPAPSPATLEHARHLIQTMHAEKMVDQVISAMQTSMITPMMKNVPAGKREATQAFEDAYLDGLRGMMPKVFDQMAIIYATDFTDQELTDMDRFYTSPTGQTLLAKTPMISQQLIPFVVAQIPDILGHAFDQSCAKASCTPEQRAAIAKALDAMRARTATKPG